MADGLDGHTLRIAIVGAGIAGLTNAVALRQRGLSVQVFERSKFASEIGAALALSPNGAKVLDSLGFSWQRARATEAEIWETVHGRTLQRLNAVDFRDSVQRYGAPLRLIHRVDLHQELLRLACEHDGEHPPVTLNLSSEVTSVESERGLIKFQDGSLYHADLIVAADGVHSAVRKSVLKDRVVKTEESGISAFRFLVPTEALKADGVFNKLLETKARGSTILVDADDPTTNRHMVWYDCRNGEVQNFVGVHPTRLQQETDLKKSVLDEFSHFNPEITGMVEIGESISCWPLPIFRPLDTWVYGKAVLIGDAAHPMLPFGGQGSNQAIEDAGALGYLLHHVTTPQDLELRLRIFERVRRRRASVVQLLSKVLIGREAEVHPEIAPFMEIGEKMPGSFQERIDHHYGYDVLNACKQALDNNRTM